MQTIKQLYREGYTGEDVVTNLVYRNATWETTKEWIPNAITNIYTTTQALVIGGGPSWKEVYGGFELTHIATHKGGLLGADRLHQCRDDIRQPLDDAEVLQLVLAGVRSEEHTSELQSH